MKKPFVILILILFSVFGCLAISSGNNPSHNKHKAAGGSHYKRTASKIPDSVYISRLEVLPFGFKPFYNAKVRKSIELYTIRSKSTMARAIGLSAFYFPMIEAIFAEYELPLELKYIAVLESGLNPKAVGKGVAGMWQFTRGTAQKFGLAVNSQVDERRSIIESTVAVAKYLKVLNGMYNNWQMVLAAYNCGYGRLNYAIRRAGGSHDFKKLAPYLPAYTQHFLPTFIGIAYAFNYYKEHDIKPVSHHFPPTIDTVSISQHLHLQQVANALKIDIATLRAINAQYVKDVIPANGNSVYNLYIPSEYKKSFVELPDSMLYAPVSGRNSPEYMHAVAISKHAHKVRTGETLYAIAKRYKVTIADLKQWNSIHGSIIRAGQVLTVHQK